MSVAFPEVRRWLRCGCLALAICWVGLGTLVGVGEAAEVRVDGSARQGEMRPLHGVNNGPLNLGETVDLSAYYRELQIPLVRLHDSEWPSPDVVDMHAIFPDPHADPNIPDNYRFARTDAYIQAVVDTGAEVVYRLGESIETTREKYYVHPPVDADHWAAACLGIIRHYNDGWADGFHHGIRYWETWNEPENRPAMWTGDDEDYYRLYATTARAIRAYDPKLKIGGPSIGAPGEFIDDRLRPSPFLQDFLARCREQELPLDFFSWHTYSSDPQIFQARAAAIRRLLDERGFGATELHLNEWNYLPDEDWSPIAGTAGQGLPRQRFYQRQGGAEGAAFVASALCSLQDSPLDAANYYSGDTNQFGLFDRYGAPKKTFYAFRAFARLLETPLRLQASAVADGHVAVCAGVDREGTLVQILVANFDAADPQVSVQVSGLPWEGPTEAQVFALDADRDLEAVRSEIFSAGDLRLQEPLAAPTVLLIQCRKH